METKRAGLSLGGVLQIVFLVLKLTKLIKWSWWWVWSPIWIGAILFVLLFIIEFIIIYRSM